MTKRNMLNLVSLREQVYAFMREEMHTGRLLPGDTINTDQMSEHLGISRTPLRDALIRLEAEGFVTIVPRRGIRVNGLTLQDVKNFYTIIGALEGAVIFNVFDRLQVAHLDRLKKLSQEMRQVLKADEFDAYYEKNLAFHDSYLALSGNYELKKIVTPLKLRLYDFPRRSYIKEWELRNCDEHDRFVALVEQGDREGAAGIIRDVHWSFAVQEQYIRRFHDLVSEKIQAEQAFRRQNGSRELEMNTR